MTYIVAVDSGGTFADCCVIDAAGRVTRAKAPSTPADYSQGVLASVERAAGMLGLTEGDLLAQSVLFGHGTTVGTNMLLQRAGCRVGLLTTRGHEDAILIGRTIQKIAGLSEEEIRNVAYQRKPDPIVPRPFIRGVRERIDCLGQVVAPLNLEDARRGARELVAQGAEALAVCLLWSFLNPAHEQAIVRALREEYPHLFITCSNELAPVLKEYERTATTALNAYLGPGCGRYLDALAGRVRAAGFSGNPVVMQSSGGVMPIEMAREQPVALLNSGPAGGVIAAAALGRQLGFGNILTTDVGGTSFDVGLIVDGEVLFSDNPVFAQYHILFPMIDVVSIGSGGGSIAWLEPGTGRLRVGPRSAGADPGPACYRQGGTEPTVTDADVVLGRINPDYFLAGTKPLYRELAEEAIRRRIAEPLEMSVEEAAIAIVDIVDAQMADLVRKVSVDRGYDPRAFALFAFGGAGPLHVGGYGRGCGARLAVAPALASAFSAFGIAASDMATVQEVSDPMVAPLDPERLNTLYGQLEARVHQQLERSGIPGGQHRVRHAVKMRYRGQLHELLVPVADGVLDEAKLGRLIDDFEIRYEQKYGKGAAYRKAGMEAITYEARGTGLLYTPEIPAESAVGPDASGAQKGQRPVYFREFGGYRDTPIYDADRLHSGNRIAGPAVIEAIDTTILIHPGQHADVDPYHNVLLHLA